MDISNLKITKVLLDASGKVIEKASTRRGVTKVPKIEGLRDVTKINGHWDFPQELGTLKQFGFIYAIFDPETKRGYIGKKQFLGTGKLNRGEVSNWRRYTSSSKELGEAIRQRGIQNFRFIVLEQYYSRGTLSYAESWSLMTAETPTSSNWYNVLVEKVSWPVKEPITDRHKERLQMVINLVKEENKCVKLFPV